MGVTEDGIMTSELLESLCMEHRVEDTDTNMNADQKGIIQTIPPKVRLSYSVSNILAIMTFVCFCWIICLSGWWIRLLIAQLQCDLCAFS